MKSQRRCADAGWRSGCDDAAGGGQGAGKLPGVVIAAAVVYDTEERTCWGDRRAREAGGPGSLDRVTRRLVECGWFGCDSLTRRRITAGQRPVNGFREKARAAVVRAFGRMAGRSLGGDAPELCQGENPDGTAQSLVVWEMMRERPGVQTQSVIKR